MCFMMWMMGSGIQIFSIFMVMSGLFGPLMAIYRSGQGEARGNIGCLGLGVADYTHRITQTLAYLSDT